MVTDIVFTSSGIIIIREEGSLMQQLPNAIDYDGVLYLSRIFSASAFPHFEGLYSIGSIK